MTTRRRTPLRAAILAVLTTLPTQPLAQTWQGLTLGLPLPDTTRADTIIPPDQSFAELPTGWENLCLHTWLRPRDGVWAAMTKGCDGPVQRLYLDSGLFAPDAAPAHLGSLSFGTTTLADVRALFGSEGLRVAHIGDPRPGLIYTLQYGVQGHDAVLTLTFNSSDPAKGIDVPAMPRDKAWLAAVELATTTLAATAYDGATPDELPGYTPIPDLFVR